MRDRDFRSNGEIFFNDFFFFLLDVIWIIFLESFTTPQKQYHVDVDNSTTPIIYSQPSLLCAFHLRHRLRTIFFIFTFEFFFLFSVASAPFDICWLLCNVQYHSIHLAHWSTFCVCAFFFSIWYATWRVTWMCHFNLFHSFWFYNYG